MGSSERDRTWVGADSCFGRWLEAGRTNPAWGTVARIAAALDVGIAELAQRADRLTAEPLARETGS